MLLRGCFWSLVCREHVPDPRSGHRYRKRHGSRRKGRRASTHSIPTPQLNSQRCVCERLLVVAGTRTTRRRFRKRWTSRGRSCCCVTTQSNPRHNLISLATASISQRNPCHNLISGDVSERLIAVSSEGFLSGQQDAGDAVRYASNPQHNVISRDNSDRSLGGQGRRRHHAHGGG